MFRNHTVMRFLAGWLALMPLATLAGGPSMLTPTQTPAKYTTCPLIKDIRKQPDTQTWSNNTGEFRNFDKSFANALKTFVGAQWNGATVGQIICVYLPKNKNVFPVMLTFKTLVYQPQGKKWGKPSQGIINCVSHQQTDCPFRVRTEPKVGNIYDIARELRKTAPPSDTTPGY